jgi:peptide/nickel transport system substrate-binding protein
MSDAVHDNFRRTALGRMLRIATAGGLLAAALLGASAGAQTRGGTLVVLSHPEPTTLNNALTSAHPPIEVGTKIFDGLLEYDMALKPLPSLAESWTISDGGKTVTFKLRRGVKWHDGKPFTSADVQFSLMEVVKPLHPRGPGNLGPVTAIETPDANTAVFRLAHPYPPMMLGLSSSEAPIVPKHLYAGTDLRNNPANLKPVGTGPYRFVSWERGTAITLERNPDYWRAGKPNLDRMIFRYINDAATRAAAIEKGEAHVASFGTITPAEMRRLASLPTITIPTGGFEMLAPVLMLEMNNRKAPLNDKRVRQAIAYAVDRKLVAETIFFGFGKPAVGPISSVYEGAGLFTREGVLSFDAADRLKKAAALLDEAGFPAKAGGVRFELVHDVGAFGEDYRRLGEYLRQALGRVGIKVTLRNEDWPTWLKRIFTDYDYDITSGWYVGMGDPTLGVQRQYLSSNIKPGVAFSNGTRYSDPEIDKLWAQVAVEPDAGRRAAAFHQIQRKLVEDSPIVWLMEMQLVMVANKRVSNLITSPLGMRAGLYDVSLTPQ